MSIYIILTIFTKYQFLKIKEKEDFDHINSKPENVDLDKNEKIIPLPTKQSKKDFQNTDNNDEANIARIKPIFNIINEQNKNGENNLQENFNKKSSQNVNNTIKNISSKYKKTCCLVF